MEMTVCNSGLKVITKEQGLTEYRAHRITYNVCPEQHPRLFVWVYKHEGKKLKVRPVNSTLFARWQQRCDLSLSVLRQFVHHCIRGCVPSVL